jgi:hypothetical protein
VRRVAASAAIAIAASCAVPEVGPPLRERCFDVDSDPEVDVSYSIDIVAGIFNSLAIDCVKCHTASGASPIGLEVGGLDLSSYAGLRAGGANGGERIVVPGSPCSSVLVQKVSAGPPFGSRMPLSGPPFLGERELQLLGDWIAEGADDN